MKNAKKKSQKSRKFSKNQKQCQYSQENIRFSSFLVFQSFRCFRVDWIHEYLCQSKRTKWCIREENSIPCSNCVIVYSMRSAFDPIDLFGYWTPNTESLATTSTHWISVIIAYAPTLIFPIISKIALLRISLVNWHLFGNKHTSG